LSLVEEESQYFKHKYTEAAKSYVSLAQRFSTMLASDESRTTPKSRVKQDGTQTRTKKTVEEV